MHILITNYCNINLIFFCNVPYCKKKWIYLFKSSMFHSALKTKSLESTDFMFDIFLLRCVKCFIIHSVRNRMKQLVLYNFKMARIFFYSNINSKILETFYLYIKSNHVRRIISVSLGILKSASQFSNDYIDSWSIEFIDQM